MGLFEQNAHNQTKLWRNSWNRLLIGCWSLCECVGVLESTNQEAFNQHIHTHFTKWTPSFENCKKLGCNFNRRSCSFGIYSYFITCFCGKDIEINICKGNSTEKKDNRTDRNSGRMRKLFYCGISLPSIYSFLWTRTGCLATLTKLFSNLLKKKAHQKKF